MSGISTPDAGPIQIDPYIRRFDTVLRRLPVEQQAIIEGVTNSVNPAAGADFLAETPQQEVLPLLFSLLIGGDISTNQKAQALSNIRAALVDPSNSGLSQKIAETPELFFNNLVAQSAQETLGFGPTPKAQQYLNEIFSNFQAEIAEAQFKTLAGENLDIFKTGARPLNSAHFLEAVIAGALDKKFPEDFRQTLVRTLLFAASNPSFFTGLIFSYASYSDTLQIGDLLPRIMRTETSQERAERERREETAKLRIQLRVTRAQHAQSELRVRQNEQELLGRDRQIRNLEEQLAQARARRPSSSQREKDLLNRIRALEEILAQARARSPSFNERLGARRDPFEVLDIPPSATKRDILSAYRTLSMAFHPDTINAILEQAKIRERQAKGFRDIATGRMQQINQAFEELKRQGRA